MKRILRSAVLGASIATSAVVGFTPASATPGGVGAFVGTAHIGSFGTGFYGPFGNSADLTALGVALAPPGTVINGQVTSTAASATDTTQGYRVFEDPAQCPVTGSAIGKTAGAVVVEFNWTRVGVLAVITTTGQIDGAAVAAFAVTSPVGDPCGRPVDAIVAGVIAGT